MSFEEFYQRRMDGFLSGPVSLRLGCQELRPGHRYRSSTLAILIWGAGLARYTMSLSLQLMILPALFAVLYSILAQDAFTRLWLLILPALWFTDCLFGFLFRPRLELRRNVPRIVRQGKEFTIRFSVRNRRFLPALDIVCDPFGYGPGLQETKNAGIPFLGPRRKTVCSARVMPLRRGRTKLYSCRAESQFPFHLFLFGCRIPHSETEVLVYPDFPEVKQLEFFCSAPLASSMASGSERLGESGEFRSIREYREGDDIRHICWKESARLAEFTVREWELPHQACLLVVTDTTVPPDTFRTRRELREALTHLEAALSLTLGVLVHLLEKKAGIRFLCTGDPEKLCDTADFRSCCEAVALAEARPGADPAEIRNILGHAVRHCDGIVLILSQNGIHQHMLRELLKRTGIPLRIVRLSEAESPVSPEEKVISCAALQTPGGLSL